MVYFMDMKVGKKSKRNSNKYVTKLEYDVLHKKYDQAVEAYNSLLYQIKQLQRVQFGSTSERFVEIIDGQQSLFEDQELVDFSNLEEDDDSEDNTDRSGSRDNPNDKERTRKKKSHISDYDHLPTREEVILADESEKKCECGCEKKRVGFEEKWYLNYIPATFEQILSKREKVSCPKCKEKIITAKPEPHILPKSVASIALLAHVVISKIIDRQPLYHLEKYWLERFGVKISRQTLAKWVIASSKKLMPLVNLIKEEIISYHLSTIDATSIQVLKEEGRKATTLSSMYCIRGGPPDKRGILYEYNAKKHKSYVERIYDEFKGVIQSDAQDIFVNLDKKDDINMSYCNAHARRKFEPIAKASSSKGIAYKSMMYFKKLYKIEAMAKKEKLSVKERLKLRQEESKPIINEFHSFLKQSKEMVLPQSPLGNAIQYSLKYWEGLTRFLNDGELEIDNNDTEREIKVLVMARKNFLFAYSVEGAEALGIYFSIIQSSRAHGIEPEKYLTTIFKEIPLCKSIKDYEKLLPWNIKHRLNKKIQTTEIKKERMVA